MSVSRLSNAFNQAASASQPVTYETAATTAYLPAASAPKPMKPEPPKMTTATEDSKMPTPPKPWPRPNRFDDALSEIVAAGDIAGARNYFDNVFWESQQERPGWKHLRLATLREDLPMIRLLATWGAHPTQDDMAVLRAQESDKYLRYVQLLRQGGLRSNGQPWEDIVPDAVKAASVADDPVAGQTFVDGRFVDKRVEKLPTEWRHVLQGFHNTGAPEAVIAGGALRDLFNARAIRDVDIFMRSQGGQKKNKQFIQAAFAAAGIDIVEQEIRYDDGYGFSIRKEAFPEPKGHTEKSSDPKAGKRVRALESWKIMAGKDKTEYNLIFVEDTLDRKLAKDASRTESKSIFVGGLLESFDLGITQIASDGQEIVSTRGYDEDVRLKRLTLLRPNDATVDHATRIIKKYPDFEQSRELKELLKPQTRHPSRYESWS